MNEEKILDISWGTILKITVAFLGFYILYRVRDVLVLIILASILSVLFDPVINFLQRRKIPRPISTLFVYVSIFGILGLFIYYISPLFISEIQKFNQLFPQYFEKLSPILRGIGMEAFENFETFTKTLQEWLLRASLSIFGVLIAIFGGIFSAITIFALSIFISLEGRGIEQGLKLFLPRKYEAYFLDLWERCKIKTTAWFGSRILCCFFVGILSYFALWLFDVNYAFSLGLFAGITNIIPIFGPILAAILITIIAGLDSWLKALFVLIAFSLIHQIEGNILTPILTKKLIGLPPVLVLIALMMGGKLWGILGAILSIPLAGIIYEFLKDFLVKREEI
jgi:predicted PurR-regulated permease PerM